MRPSRGRTLIVLACLVGVLGWWLLDLWQGSGKGPLPVPWTAPIGLAVLAGIVLVAGREVRRSVIGARDRPLDPLVAARTAVLAKAASYVGAVLTGWYAAQAAVILPELLGERRTRFVLSVISAVIAGGLAVAGLLAQRWCRRPPDDGDDTGELS